MLFVFLLPLMLVNKDYHIVASVLAADAFAIMINSAEQVFVSLCLFVYLLTG